MNQVTALSILKTGANVFITGEPGSGKTYLVNQYIAWLREHGIEPAITASTGIAATHIGGMTIHSWSGLGIRKTLSRFDLDMLAGKEKLARRITKTHILIIDEISMLDARTLSMVNEICCTVRQNNVPFGGMQIIFVGDFFQLPPVDREKNGGKFAFESPAWQKTNPLVCYLSEQHRQSDAEFLDLLVSIRKGSITESIRARLSGRIIPTPKGPASKLFPHNVDVDRINEEELEKLEGRAHTFLMKKKGSKPFAEQLARECLSPETLVLKEGAHVMFTKNNPEEGFYNGTQGMVIKFSKENGSPIVKTRESHIVRVTPMEWTKEENGKVLARIIQLPLRLAWAITIHKSQGVSLDAAIIDLSLAFEHGQGYVALSRVRSLAGLFLLGFNEQALLTSPIVHACDAEFLKASEEAAAYFGNIDQSELKQLEKNFIRACGGRLELKPKKEKHSRVKLSTEEKTRELLLQKLSLTEIAKARNMTVGTILGHLENLAGAGKIDLSADCGHMKPSDSRFEIMKAAFEKIFKEMGAMRLAPAREILGETFDYEELRLARLFLFPPDKQVI